MLSEHARAVNAVAESVVSTLERLGEDESLAGVGRAGAISGLAHEVASVMPAPFAGMLAAACNRYLSTIPDWATSGPRVETVDMVDGSVTMKWAQSNILSL